MGRWVLGFAGSAGIAFAFMHVSACSLDVDGTADTVDATADQMTVDAHPVDNFVPLDGGGDVQPGDARLDTSPIDSSPPDAPPDAPPCSAFLCGTACVTTCNGCPFGEAQCNADRNCGDCSTCTDGKFGCFTCNGGVLSIGLCQGMKCNTPDPQSCPCATGDAAACPGTTQVCSGGGNPLCKTCGTGGTDMKQCANGKPCDEGMGTCH